MGLSVDGKVEAVVESEAFPTLEAAIGHSEYLAQTVRAVSYTHLTLPTILLV